MSQSTFHKFRSALRATGPVWLSTDIAMVICCCRAIASARQQLDNAGWYIKAIDVTSLNAHERLLEELCAKNRSRPVAHRDGRFTIVHLGTGKQVDVPMVKVTPNMRTLAEADAPYTRR